MTEEFPSKALDNELLLSDGATITAAGPTQGQVNGSDAVVELVPGRAYVASVDVSAVDTADTDESYFFAIFEHPTSTLSDQYVQHRSEVFTTTGVKEMRFIAKERYCSLVTLTFGTTPSVTIDIASIAGVKN